MHLFGFFGVNASDFLSTFSVLTCADDTSQILGHWKLQRFEHGLERVEIVQVVRPQRVPFNLWKRSPDSLGSRFHFIPVPKTAVKLMAEIGTADQIMDLD